MTGLVSIILSGPFQLTHGVGVSVLPVSTQDRVRGWGNTGAEKIS